MTAGDVRKLIANEYDGLLVEPVSVEDCRAIYADLKPRIAPDSPLDVVIRGFGTLCDPGPKRVEVETRDFVITIAVQS